jgi:hypothetical protein
MNIAAKDNKCIHSHRGESTGGGNFIMVTVDLLMAQD